MENMLVSEEEEEEEDVDGRMLGWKDWRAE
jgi:hypothetical protein